MKTAMQELLEWHRLSMRSYSETNKMIETLLEKEKMQIKKAVYDSMGTNFDPNMGRAEMYYNELYNQNK